MRNYFLFVALVFCTVNPYMIQSQTTASNYLVSTNGGNTAGAELKSTLDNKLTVLDQRIDNAGAAPQLEELTLVKGRLFGTTEKGGANNLGSLFELNPDDGIVKKGIDFQCTVNGTFPCGKLTSLGSKLYGMTRYGGKYNMGTLFEFDPATGSLTTKIDFSGFSNGAYPYGSLTAVGTILFGMTENGGENGMGVLFEFHIEEQALVKKIDFAGASNGAFPYGSLTSNGDLLYGMSAYGGINNEGVLFEYNPLTSILTKLADFSAEHDGSIPMGSLTSVGSELYGTTFKGGRYGKGILFVYKPQESGEKLIKKIDFNAGEGSYPMGSLIYTADHVLLGMTSSGGKNNLGTVYEYSIISEILSLEFDFNAMPASKPICSQLITERQVSGQSAVPLIPASACTALVYPNPSSGCFSIVPDGDLLLVTLTNALGQQEIFLSKEIYTSFRGLVTMEIETTKGIVVKKLEVR